jgi:hypothetical protein
MLESLLKGSSQLKAEEHLRPEHLHTRFVDGDLEVLGQ